MAIEIGTATDYRDLLQKLKAFLTGTNSPSSGLNYTVMEERSQYTSPLSSIALNHADAQEEDTVNHNQDHDQIIFKGTGGVSPERDWYFGIQTLGKSLDGYYNWHMRGFTGFATSSPQYVDFMSQPGVSPPAFLLLQNSSMQYWFTGNDRHVKGVVKTGTAYHSFYIGYLNTFSTEAEYPYPLAIVGTADTENVIFSGNAIINQGFLNPGGSTTQAIPVPGDPFPVSRAVGYARFNNGIWYKIQNFEEASGGGKELQTTTGSHMAVWPQCHASATYGALGNTGISAIFSWAQDFRNLTPGDAASIQLAPTFGSPQQTLMFPLTVVYPEQNQLIGEFDGCYWVPATGGITSEDTIIDYGESPEITNYIFQNTWRTDPWCYLGMRFE